MKKWLFVIFLIIVLTGGGVYTWEMISSPQYSLKKLDQAIDERDMKGFQKYVDLDQMVDSMIVQSWEFYIEGEEVTENRWDRIRQEITNSLLSVVKPNIKEIVKEEIINYIATGQWNNRSDQQDESVADFLVGFIKARIDLEQWDRQSINYTQINGDLAQVGLTYYDEVNHTHFLVEIKMVNKGNHWQVIEIINMGQLLNIFQNIDKLSFSTASFHPEE